MSREKDAMIGPLWWIIFLTGIFSVNYGGGFSVALVFCWGIIGMYWIPERGKTNNILGGREYDAGLLGDARNPLFLQGHVRKDYRYTGRRFSLAGLKGIYYTQVHAIFQMIVFGIYGIICAISGFKRYEDLEMIFFLWGVFGIIVFEIFVWYYKRKLKHSIVQKKPVGWFPFEYHDFGKQFETEPVIVDQVLNETELFRKILKTHASYDKIFAIEKSIGEQTDVFMVGEEHDLQKRVNIRMFIRTEELCRETLSELNSLFAAVEKKYLLGFRKSYDWYLSFIISVKKESPVFYDILRYSVFQKEKRYRLPVGISREKEIVYIASQKDHFGIENYKELKRDIIGRLGLERK